ncbi:hypothetical protein F8M41_012052 [Gigaspora margarita]|uniref:Uncharacterized protein n=1 Tax=Gigaspora margarita TaxID=4874 RepID=A0A8H4ATB0_GIGMA|nr:hypothetical protein F8M41_012052 [Gigaspora margarita]
MYDKRISQRKNYLKSIPQKGKITKTPFKRNFCHRKAYKYTQQDVVEHQSKSEHTQQNEQQEVSDWSELDTGSDYDDDIYWEYDD